jgi:enamine deaminase RidA (YjgF/YER057c/UK114 family)
MATGKIAARLREIGVDLPTPPVPAANYVPWVISGGLAFIAGQIPTRDGQPQFIGKVGREFTLEQGQEAARLCGLNILAHLRAACGGDLDRVRRCAKVGGFVNCAADFTDMPKVVNGASDLFVQVFGDNGKHARFAVGAAGLPRGVAVEVDAIFELNP